VSALPWLALAAAALLRHRRRRGRP
jgi:hypothetical protein